MSTVDLCVVNYKTPLHLERLIHCLLTESSIDNRIWRLLIADNGGDEESKYVIKQYSDVIDYVFYNENIGYSAACNQMANAGTSDYVALLNSDIWMPDSAVNQIINFMDSDPSIAVVGPKQINEAGRIVHAGIVGTNEAPKHRGWKLEDRNDEMFKDIVDCVTVSGSAYFVRKSIWNELADCPKYRASVEYMNVPEQYSGAFLPTPHYYEETFCSYHATAHGYRVVYNGEISIGHTWHASSAIGGEADQHFRVSQKIFRQACDYHEISHD